MLKGEIIEAGRQIVLSGLVAGTWGNISGWDTTREGYWITPSGMDYLSLQEEDLVLMDLQNRVVCGKRKPSSEFLLHGEIYRQRPDLRGIVHTHSVYATAHAVARKPLPGLVEDLVMIVGGQVDVAEYRLPGSRELAVTTVRTLADKNAVLLANHGLVGAGRSVREAVKVCQVVEKSAHIHLMSLILGTPYLLSPEDICALRWKYLHHYGQGLG